MPVPESAWSQTVVELGAGLRSGQFSSVELTTYFLDRLERVGKPLNAVVALLPDRAMSAAQTADAELKAGRDHGPLHGIPYGAKDLLAARGGPTTWGCEIFRDRVIGEEATVIERLTAASAVLVAKLSMVELAGGLGYRQANATFTGPGRNPWNRDSWAGGSSCGSAAAVAAGCVPFALGSETWGSITVPAAYCGVTGLRPTLGRVSRYAAMALSWSMDKIGPITRTVHDASLVLAAIAGPDPRDPATLPEPWQHQHPPATKPVDPPAFKIAVLKNAARRAQPEIEKQFSEAISILQKLGTVEEIELPRLPYSAVAQTIIACECASAFRALLANGKVAEMTAPEDRYGLHASQQIPAVDYIAALRLRETFQQQLLPLFAPFDAVIMPTTSTVASPLALEFGEYQGSFRTPPLNAAANVLGWPAVTVPMGLGERGLPVGLMFTAAAGRENRLLAVAAGFQQNSPALPLPPLE